MLATCREHGRNTLRARAERVATEDGTCRARGGNISARHKAANGLRPAIYSTGFGSSSHPMRVAMWGMMHMAIFRCPLMPGCHAAPKSVLRL